MVRPGPFSCLQARLLFESTLRRKPRILFVVQAGLVAAVVVLSVLFRHFIDCGSIFPYMRERIVSYHQVPDNARVVMSLTTFGARTENLLRVIPSLLNQSRTPDRIVVSIPAHSRASKYGMEANLTTTLHEIDKAFGPLVQVASNAWANGPLYVQFLETDFGPATKLLGAVLVEKDPETIIITVDDDCTYDPGLIDVLVQHMPADAALGLACEEMPMALNSPTIMGDIGWYRYGIYSWNKHQWSKDHEIMECQGWLMGYTGIAYKRGFFGDDALDASAMPAGCFIHDDVRLSGYLYSKGIRRYVYPHFVPPNHVSKHKELAINTMENQTNLATAQYKHQLPCVRHFNNFGKQTFFLPDDEMPS